MGLAGVEPALSDLGIRNAKFTPERFVHNTERILSNMVHLSRKKLFAPTGIEPGPSHVGIRNATITPGCFIHKHSEVHILIYLYEGEEKITGWGAYVTEKFSTSGVT